MLSASCGEVELVTPHSSTLAYYEVLLANDYWLLLPATGYWLLVMANATNIATAYLAVSCLYWLLLLATRLICM